jgi:hypothetical protein
VTYFRQMTATTPGSGPYLCGAEKHGTVVGYATALVRHEALKPDDLLIIDVEMVYVRVVGAGRETDARRPEPARPAVVAELCGCTTAQTWLMY